MAIWRTHQQVKEGSSVFPFLLVTLPFKQKNEIKKKAAWDVHVPCKSRWLQDPASLLTPASCWSAPGRQSSWLPGLGPCHSHGRPGLRPQVLAMTWPSSGSSEHLRKEPVGRRSSHLSFSEIKKEQQAGLKFIIVQFFKFLCSFFKIATSVNFLKNPHPWFQIVCTKIDLTFNFTFNELFEGSSNTQTHKGHY